MACSIRLRVLICLPLSGEAVNEPPLTNCFQESQALACDLSCSFDAEKVHLEQVKLCIFAEGLNAEASNGAEHCESERAALLESSENLNLCVAQATLVDVGLVAEACPIFAAEVRVVLCLTKHFDFFGTLDCAASIAANRGGNVIENARRKLHIRHALLDDVLHLAVAVGDKINHRETILEGSKQTIHFSRCEDEAHLREVESVFHILISVVDDCFLFCVQDGEKSSDEFLGQFVRFIEEKHTFGALNLWHQLLKELFFVLDAAAVDLVKGLLRCCAKGAGKLGLANSALPIEHEERQNVCGFVSIKVKAELTLDVILTDDVFEGWVHGGGGSL